MALHFDSCAYAMEPRFHTLQSSTRSILLRLLTCRAKSRCPRSSRRGANATPAGSLSNESNQVMRGWWPRTSVFLRLWRELREHLFYRFVDLFVVLFLSVG